MLVDAFAGDPILTHLLHGPEDEQGHPAFFRSMINEHLGGGHVYGAWEGAELVGVAIWLPPDGIAVPSAARRTAAADQRLLRRLYPQGMLDIEALFEVLGPLHPPEPHWYLAFVGVEPDRQGRGTGRRLLAPVLDLADQSATPCYLETPAAATLAFYRRSGFEVVSEQRPFPRLELPLWTMIRAPRSDP